jgi:hypothetical protein
MDAGGRSIDALNLLSDVDRVRLERLSDDERPRTVKWLRSEIVRRRSLEAETFCPTYLVSFPRSGNHAVRYAVERLAQQPTLGANDHESFVPPKGMHDLPVFLRDPRLNVTKAEPILVKRHKIRSFDSVWRLVHLRRDPAEAILSHTRGVATDLDLHVSHWCALETHYSHHSAKSRIVIEFDDLAGNEWLTRLADFLGLDVSRRDIAAVVSSLDQAQTVLRRRPQTLGGVKWAHRYPREAEAIRDAIVNLGV